MTTMYMYTLYMYMYSDEHTYSVHVHVHCMYRDVHCTYMYCTHHVQHGEQICTKQPISNGCHICTCVCILLYVHFHVHLIQIELMHHPHPCTYTYIRTCTALINFLQSIPKNRNQPYSKVL
jgi:hypothetical protein